jgi:peptide/nickel transport system substrate-binding protein
MRKKSRLLAPALILIVAIALAACARNHPDFHPTETSFGPEPIPTHREVTTAVETIVVPAKISTPSMDSPQLPNSPRTLVICMGQEPETLYTYGGSSQAQSRIFDAVYDGPIDNRFDFQPVILEKIPSLADSDAVIKPVARNNGDTIVDATGGPLTLEEGVHYRPSGCSHSDCERTYMAGDGTILMDQMVATFTLKIGIHWSDGHDLTAHDSVYAYDLRYDPDAIGHVGGEPTESYFAVDSGRVVWTGLAGYQDSTYFTNFWSPLPEHDWSEYSAGELIEAEVSAEKPIGWGPYRIVDWLRGDHVRLERNPYYHRADEGLPAFDILVFRFVGENAADNLTKIANGECDILDQTARVGDHLELAVELERTGQIQLLTTPGTVWEHLDFGIVPADYDDGYQPGIDRPDFFGDVRTRQAITLCLDRQRIVDEVFFGRSEVIHSYLTSAHPLLNPDAPHYPHSPLIGTTLLEAVGWLDQDEDSATPRTARNIPGIPNGTPLSFNYWTTNATQRQQVVAILAGNLAECGIQTNVAFWEPGDYSADGPDGPLFGRRFDLGQYAWLTGVDPPCDLWLSESIPGEDIDFFPYGWGGRNNSGWSDPEFDAACNAAIQSLPGQLGYERNHLLAQAIFAELLPVIPLYAHIKAAAARADFCGLDMDPTVSSEYWNIEAFDFGPGCKGN